VTSGGTGSCAMPGSSAQATQGKTSRSDSHGNRRTGQGSSEGDDLELGDAAPNRK
jgi:hypothetical protein